MQVPLLLLELNEVNFEFVEAYARRGALPNFGALLREHGYVRTRSEDKYEQLEPWIQWVTAHTGRSFAEHGVFRLGDIVSRDIPQIWELLEARGLKVGAISPMNAKHRLRDPAFFVPDPWTRTEITAPRTLRNLYTALTQAVSENATSTISAASALALALGVARYARPSNYARYTRIALGAVRQPWLRASFLDLLLADVFIREVQRTRPQFASLFVNAAAHIQHHYMFSAAPYDGPHRNPEWYVPRHLDPVLDVYELYDHIFASVRRAFPASRIMVATGLHQDPYPEVKYYWRLRQHELFLRRIGVPFASVEPLMSRDFLVKCTDESQARSAAQRLSEAIAGDGAPLFDVDNRGVDIFAMLVYQGPIERGFRFRVGTTQYDDLHDAVAFVALKNGEHNGTGYFLDTGAAKGSVPAEFPLTEMPRRIMQALNVDGPASQAA
ncbi:MAG TPA: hypothetical protein VGQ22_06585 [Steroidobacteraceae bacterium]|jgi:hypothetical protein|nr:hypothetical protein [Steroidobacteraceae bacterium]